MNEQFVVCEHGDEFAGGCNFYNVIYTDSKDAMDFILEKKLLGKAMIYKLTKYLHELSVLPRE